MKKVMWRKEDLLPKINSREYSKLLDTLEREVRFVESFREKLNPGIKADEFMQIIKANEVISEISSRLGCYSHLWFSEDILNHKAKSFMSSVDERLTKSSNRILFFSLWFKSLEESDAARIIKNVPYEYRYFLESVRKTRKYTLTEAEEKVVNIKDVNGSEAVHKIYEVITNNFTFKLKNKKNLTREELSKYVKDKNPGVRRVAYQELYNVYEKNSGVLCDIYRYRVLDWKSENLDLRHFDTPMSVRNIANDISDRTAETLLRTCRKNRNIFQDYFRLKAKLCRIKNMTRYDIYAPYGFRKKYSYEDSKGLVFKSYQAFSPEMARLAGLVADKNHVDYNIRKGKMGGAYALGAGPGFVPYVMLNHTKELRDVFTIAHEFGHAVHYLLSRNHSILTCHAPLVLAETASVFGELLLFESFMKDAKNNSLKKSLLINKLDDIYATIGRQSYFVLFEIKAHEMIAKGAGLDELNKAYLDNLREQFGSSVKVSEEFKYEWLSIPHIYDRQFYCYSYAFGNLLVLALYEKYKKEGKSFVDKYLKILSYGGSENPAKILKEVGINIEDEKFWQGGFDLVKEMVEELKKLS